MLKYFSIIIGTFLLLILSSCEGRTGYLEDGRQNTVAMLTDVEWLVVYADYGLDYGQTFDDETNISRPLIKRLCAQSKATELPTTKTVTSINCLLVGLNLVGT